MLITIGYTFCTTRLDPLVAPKRPMEMAVILSAEDHERWLTASVEDAVTLLAPCRSQMMAVA